MRVFKKIMNNYSIKTKIPFPIFDIYHFRWNPLSGTHIHDHAKNGCLMILLRGKLYEKIYNKDLDIIKENEYKSPNISYINNKTGYHSVKSVDNATSLHIYYPKGHKTKYYKK